MSSKALHFHIPGKYIGILSLILFMVISWYYMKGFSKEPSPIIPLIHRQERLIVPQDSPLRQLITMAVTKDQTVAATYILPATVEADPAKMVKMLPPTSGRISQLNKRLGDPVEAGEVLFTIDSAELAQAISDMNRAQASVLLATQTLNRQNKLGASRIAAQKDTEQAQNDYEQAISELARTKARLFELGMPNPDKDQKHKLIVKSPISGYVVELNAAPGAFWNDPNASLMTVADLSHVFVSANAQEKDLAKLFPGQLVKVKFDAYPQIFSSTVQYVSAILDPDSRTAQVKMLFNNPQGQLKPNMFARAAFSGPMHQRIVLPLTAVIQKGFDSIVFVEVAPWEFEGRIVSLGQQHEKYVEVVSGLNVGERVVITGGIALND